MRIEELSTYEIIEKREIADLNSVSYLVRHKKTGARLALLSNDDDNKVFYIGFRTPPQDSTGVAHILEHSVLCGSKNFPSKDPFVELAKGSLNTFLNAMTYPDKTVYPVASCNEKDFQNLMNVYLDAVFYPNIYRESNIFQQEGWHYEMEEAGDSLSINGVVYNEMKGAFSSPDDVLDREVLNSLYPDTTYGYESGGDPNFIPELTYENFKEFHGRFYHPSNSYIYLYGNMDMAEKLEWIDRNYLSSFEKITVNSEIDRQEAFTARREIRRQYSITEAEAEKDSTYLSYNTVVGSSLDRELYIAFQVLDYALCSASGAPLKQALIDRNIGKDVYSTFENGIYQPYFSIVAKNANMEQKEEFINVIEQTLADIVERGIDKKALKAGLNYYEFRYREADYGSYPKGLMYGLQALDSWLYDEVRPFIHIEANATFAALKEKIGSDYYEQLIQNRLLANEHKTIIIVEPVKGLTAQRDKALAEKLAQYKATLSAQEIQEIIDKTADLVRYQEEPSAKEDLAKIPLLTRSDMKKEAEGFVNELKQSGDITVLHHPIFTNGICYVKAVFDISNVPQELFPYLGILKSVLGYVDTQNLSYADLFNEINIQTGGISAALNTYTNSLNVTEFKPTFEVKVKVLHQNLAKAFELLEEIIFASKLDNAKRIYEIIAELQSRLQASMTSSGHSLAAVRAMSYFSSAAFISELTNGIPFYRLLERIESDYEHEKDVLAAKLKEACSYIFRPENLLLDYTAAQEDYEGLDSCLASFTGKLNTNEVRQEPLVVKLTKENEGFTTSSQIQYVCRAGNFIKHGLPYTGALRVLKIMMGYDYLWSNIRVKGGAYGCMSNFGKSGDSYFVSYRDPNLAKTIAVYEGAVDFLKHFDEDERTITQYIIGAISDLDAPMNPSAKGSRSLSAYLSNVDYEQIQKERDELLGVTVEGIRRLSEYVQAILADECICVVGNEEKINENKELFLKIENLFH